jgi:hypothetical protein
MKRAALFTLIILTARFAYGQTLPSDERLADQRIATASKRVPVTIKQCLADISSWQEKDSLDEKAKVDPSNYWYEKLSTEELLRLNAESSSCVSKLLWDQNRDRNHSSEITTILIYGKSFSSELLSRARSVILDHYLSHEWLLKGSK